MVSILANIWIMHLKKVKVIGQMGRRPSATRRYLDSMCLCIFRWGDGYFSWQSMHEWHFKYIKGQCQQNDQIYISFQRLYSSSSFCSAVFSHCIELINRTALWFGQSRLVKLLSSLHREGVTHWWVNVKWWLMGMFSAAENNGFWLQNGHLHGQLGHPRIFLFLSIQGYMW